MRDAVDGFIDQWGVVRPDLDVSPMGIIGRIHRLGHILEAELRPVFAEEGLGPGDFDILATLRRAGEPHVLTPTQLRESLMVTGGAITKRIDRLEAAGLVERTVSARDARGRDIKLTSTGRELADRLAEQHFANERRLLAGLSDLERTRLAALLRTLLLAHED